MRGSRSSSARCVVKVLHRDDGCSVAETPLKISFVEYRLEIFGENHIRKL